MRSHEERVAETKRRIAARQRKCCSSSSMVMREVNTAPFVRCTSA